MKNKNSNKNEKYPFSNEMKRIKYEFKRMVDAMPDEEFAMFALFFIEWVESEGFGDFEEYDDELEELEDLPF